ncbi:alpha/beta hydrolase [Streptomyces gobiensis]|uniref:alpha/beta hydrolase n=1 Tax=Streptomyces gobiensis TaxID=2875706 RepID=UPI001E58DA37|nr:alpha/beta hydrolase-fold protein [Streptomyces gobiensis]UGY92212.1 esterase [Streptomyces gobiensis]
MGLTSNKVLALAIFAAVLLFIATIWLWPKLSRNSVRSILGRIGLVLGTQLAIFATVGLLANNANGFYASWSDLKADLFGVERPKGTVTEYNSDGKPLQVRGQRSLRVRHGADPAKAGRIDEVRINGLRSGISSPALVYLPPQYFQRGYERKNFPAAVVLTGYPGTTENLITRLRVPQTASAHIQAGRLQPTILVMMRPTLIPGRDTECVDVPDGPQTETFFTRDVRGAVSTHYRVGDKAENWGIMGNSTGGYCALKMTMRHPDAFSTGVGLSADYKAPRDSQTGDLFGGSKRLENENNLTWRLDNLPPPPVSVLVTSSRQGEKNYAATRAFIKKAAVNQPPLKIASIILDSGGHNFSTWGRELAPALDWMGERLRA